MPILLRAVKKDIHRPKVENVAMAVVKETENGETNWGVFLINEKSVAISNVLVSSKGYGRMGDDEVKTSQLRHFIEEVPANGYAKVEPLIPDLFGLTNEYMLSFYIDRVIFDKKYIFLAESIIDDNLVNVPLINKPGVLIR